MLMSPALHSVCVCVGGGGGRDPDYRTKIAGTLELTFYQHWQSCLNRLNEGSRYEEASTREWDPGSALHSR